MTRFAAALMGALLTGTLFLTGCQPSAPEGDEQKDSHYLNGRARVSSLDYRGAIQEFEKALEINPRSSSAHLELALLNEEQLQDYSAAIYHYEKHLKLRPESEYAERAKDRIKSCKMDLVKGEVLGPVTMGMQKEMERLVSENMLLKQRAEALEAQLVQAARESAITPVNLPQPQTQARPQPPEPVSRAQTVAEPVNRSARNPQPVSASPATVRANSTTATRQHIVKSGEKMTTIAAKYGVPLNRLQQANPGIDARRLKIGQTLKIP